MPARPANIRRWCKPRPVVTTSPYRSDLNLPQLTANAWLRAEHIEALAPLDLQPIISGTGLGPSDEHPEGDT